MEKTFQDFVCRATGAQDIFKIEDIQRLWSGYGMISRYGLTGCKRPSVVVKHVRLLEQNVHPRGWNTDFSHQRKIRSYQVESTWYENLARRCDAGCRIPQCLALESSADEFLMVLEDLDASGFPLRKGTVTLDEIETCLAWLAHFHAEFLHQEPVGLWPVGTYWHLATRPDELAALDDQPLKRAAGRIDAILNRSPYQTLVHGDAKLANFCFARNGRQVAAVDFQYVGGGCGMKDVAYFIGSCLNEEECRRLEGQLLHSYFSCLNKALRQRQAAIDPLAVEQEWRRLFPIAWTDFHRFVKGWSPGHWKINSYSESVARAVLTQLGN